MDFQIGTQATGRVIFELFNDVTPKTAENFRGLCTGEYGNVGMARKTKKLHYLNTNVFRIADNMLIQGGDIINNDGTGVFIFLKFRVLLYMVKLSLMRISQEDMLVQDYFPWPVEDVIPIILNSLLP